MSPELLRAWERRYGLLQPTRSAGGLRLYSPADLERVRAMQQHLAEGLAAAEAAALASASSRTPTSGSAALVPRRCATISPRRSTAFDEPRAQAILDRLLAVTTVDTLLSDVLLPYLHELGDRWERGEVSVAQEHFASSVLRGRLLGLARGWGLGLGPRRVLALRARRAARPRPDRVRPRAARARLAHRLSRSDTPIDERGGRRRTRGIPGSWS